MRDLVDLVRAYNKSRGLPNADTELEVRIQSLGKLNFTTFLKAAQEDGEALVPIRTIHLISGDIGGGDKWVKWRAEFSFIERNEAIKMQESKTYTIKTRIGSIKSEEALPYKVSLATEKPRAKWDYNTFALARIRFRLPIAVKALPGWRFDFTIAAEVQKMSDLPLIKKIMFYPGQTAPTYLDDVTTIVAGLAKLGVRPKYELEVERYATTEATTEELTNVIALLYKMGPYTRAHGGDYRSALNRCADLLLNKGRALRFKRERGTLKGLGVSPIGLDKETYATKVLPNITKYTASPKADGLRCMILREGRVAKIISTTYKEVETDDEAKTAQILEAEDVDGTLYLYDVLYYNNSSFIGRPVSERLELLPGLVKEVPGLVLKTIVPLSVNHRSELRQLMTAKLPYPIDGYIFTGPNVYKMKEVPTFDLYVARMPVTTGAPQKPGFDTCYLFCTTSRHSNRGQYERRLVKGYKQIFPTINMAGKYPIQFSPLTAPKDIYVYYHPKPPKSTKEEPSPFGHIAEFRRTGDAVELVKIRFDKDGALMSGLSWGNNIMTAHKTWDIAGSGFKYEDLLMSVGELTEKSYFGTTQERYRAVNRYSNTVKRYLLEDHFPNGATTMVNLSAGRNGDLQLNKDMGIKSQISVDVDMAALNEQRRRHDMFTKRYSSYRLKLSLVLQDLSAPWEESVKKIRASMAGPTVPLITWHMAIHYFCGTTASIDNAVSLVSALLAPKGRFVFTCYNGNDIFKELRGRARVDTSDDHGALKYSIVKNYIGATMADAGQEIQTLLGFTGGQYRKEWLVNIPYIIKAFERQGFRLIKKVPFDSLLKRYSESFIDAYDKMDPSDFIHLSRYVGVVLAKRAKSVATGGAPEAAPYITEALGGSPLQIWITQQQCANIPSDGEEYQLLVLDPPVALDDAKVGETIVLEGCATESKPIGATIVTTHIGTTLATIGLKPGAPLAAIAGDVESAKRFALLTLSRIPLS